jgi:hypothetical protein
MKHNTTRKVIGFFAKTLGLLTLAASVHALPIDATVDINANNGFSVLHMGSGPGGSGDRNDWLWFDSNQTLNFDLSGGLVTLLGTQSFNLVSNNGRNAVLQITGLNLDLNDVNDGFNSGTLDYTLDNTTNGTFSFANANHNSLYNSSSYDGTNMEFYVWGGDDRNDLGIDLGVSGTVVNPNPGPNPVPVPGTLALVLLALGGLRITSKKTHV